MRTHLYNRPLPSLLGHVTPIKDNSYAWNYKVYVHIILLNLPATQEIDNYSETMEVVRDLILATPVFPHLWVPHCVLMSLALRKSLGSDHWHQFSRTHPLSCLMAALVYIYPGGILASLVLGEPPLAFLQAAGPSFYAALLVCYLVFYAPADLFVRMMTSVPGLLPLCTLLQDWQRIGLVQSGLQTVNAGTPGLFLFPVIIGVVKSSGFMFVKYLEARLLYREAGSGGFRLPNQAAKTMLLVAVILQMQHLYSPLPVSQSELYCLLVVLAVSLRLATVCLAGESEWDPYLALEWGVCSLLFGQPEARSADSDSNDKTKSRKKD